MQIEIDSYNCPPTPLSRADNDLKQISIMRLFGVNKESNFLISSTRIASYAMFMDSFLICMLKPRIHTLLSYIKIFATLFALG